MRRGEGGKRESDCSRGCVQLSGVLGVAEGPEQVGEGREWEGGKMEGGVRERKRRERERERERESICVCVLRDAVKDLQSLLKYLHTSLVSYSPAVPPPLAR